MRIAYLSDIHLSTQNIEQLENYYLKALIDDLLLFQKEKVINIVLISGDLLDKGGESFKDKNGYDVFERVFLDPIMKALGLSHEHILFIPGNHDIDRSLIDEDAEYSLKGRLNGAMANRIVKETYQTFSPRNKRMEPFKTFERTFHKDNGQYSISNYESTYIFEREKERVGFALINDSWRCSSDLKPEQHFWGSNQLFNGLKVFVEAGTAINIAVFHHPFRLINAEEEEEVNNILESKNFQLAIFGHTHHYQTKTTVSTAGSLVKLVCRSAFNDPDEQTEKYQPGYTLIDIDVLKRTYAIQARKFMKIGGLRFDKDTDSLPGGMTAGIFLKNMNFQLTEDPSQHDNSLPGAYSANVEKVVQLLIGDSLYSNPFSFVRELVQNAVDACTRIKERHPANKPRIYININQANNFFEVVDEGDGMSRRILRDHFAVIGKSISQEMSRTGTIRNLISKFGIGFISVFIAAAEVYVSTKSEEEERIRFKIKDVFKGFEYSTDPFSGMMESEGTGTTVRVYLKTGYASQKLLEQVFLFCRHIENLVILQDGKPVPMKESWNLEHGLHHYEERTPQYDLKFTLGAVISPMIASNSGFLISSSPTAIIPFRFPSIIYGEVNLTPGTVDLDLSRGNIIESAKSNDIRKRISIALKYLFQKALAAATPNLVPNVLPYLQFYLATIEQYKVQYEISYAYFYTKEELIELCVKLTMVQSNGRGCSLMEVMEKTKLSGDLSLYIYDATSKLDYEVPFAEYLSYSGRAVASLYNFGVTFRETSQNLPILTVYEKICQHYGFKIVKIAEVNSLLDSLALSSDQFPKRMIDQLQAIEKEHAIQIRLIKLSSVSRAVILVKNTFVLNIEHLGIAKLLQKAADLPEPVVKTYLLGLLRLPAKEW